MLQAQAILLLHDNATAHWHGALALSSPASALDDLVLTQHQANFDIWHQEDQARSLLASDHAITEVKHNIDVTNQRRNDLVEQIDDFLLQVAGDQNQGAPLHSETPGLIIDRLSILQLKLYHTAEEAHRESATEQHRQRNSQRLELISLQRADLAACLDELWLQVLNGRRRFRLYRQFKMYNDPELNPVLYTRA